ncbi:TrbI/VirB10 family protein [Pseudomonas boanensis]|uniref:TrbI/VirB10 family protein n=1 Tax=Metapseudomonas boanensis TaxID=2822138 RepID=UPI0035D49A22
MSTTGESQDAAPSPLPPKEAPESLELRAQPRPVTRLNPRMLAVLAGGLASAVLGAMLWSLQPQQRRDGAEQRELYNVDRVTRSEGLEQLPADYSQLPPPVAPAVPQLGPPLPGDLGGPILRAEQAQGYDYRHSGPDPAEAERLARLKEAEEAALSSVFFRSSGGRTSGATPAGPALAGPGGFDPMATASASTAVADAAATQNRQEQKEAFLSKPANAQIRNSGFLQLPDSPYQVMAGTVIAAALVTGIKSDLPGDVIATVTEPVYDSASGQHVLIPQGSRLLGRYNSQVSYGQSRVQVVWQRVILPDTSSFQLDNLVGSDTAGYAGLEDGVDWHWDRIVAGAAMTSLLGIGAELAAPENRTDGDRIIIAGRDSLQDTVNQVGQEVTRRNLDIQPTLTQRPGLPLRVIVNRDLVLRPYQPLFIPQRNPQ